MRKAIRAFWSLGRGSFSRPVLDLNSLVRDRIGPILCEKGFRATGRKFHRVSGEFEHVVAIQKGQRSKQGEFCVTLSAHPLVEGYPGLPGLPLSTGEHWLSRRLSPDGSSDRWWRADGLKQSDVDEITALMSTELDDWFAASKDFRSFSSLWSQQISDLPKAAARLGTMPARLAYLQAIVGAELGELEMSLMMAKTAQDHAGRQAVEFKSWVDEFLSERHQTPSPYSFE